MTLKRFDSLVTDDLRREHRSDFPPTSSSPLSLSLSRKKRRSLSGIERFRDEELLSGCTGNCQTPCTRAEKHWRGTDTPVESGRAERTTQRQSTQLDDSSGREHSLATATISSFRMTRYYKTPACDSATTWWSKNGHPPAARARARSVYLSIYLYFSLVDLLLIFHLSLVTEFQMAKYYEPKLHLFLFSD